MSSSMTTTLTLVHLLVDIIHVGLELVHIMWQRQEVHHHGISPDRSKQNERYTS